jgi:hypothetical protein
MSEGPEREARRPRSVPVPTSVLDSMPGMEEADLRVLLFLIKHEHISPGWRVPVRIGRITQGTGVGRVRVKHALDALVREGWVLALADGTYVLALPLPGPEGEERGQRGGSAGSAGRQTPSEECSVRKSGETPSETTEPAGAPGGARRSIRPGGRRV